MPTLLAPDTKDVSHTGHRQRLRERFLASKKGTLPDYELLEMLLFSSSPRKDVKPLAKQLIKHFGSFSRVITAEPHDLLAIDGINDAALASFRMVQESLERVLKEEVEERPILQSWKSLLDYCRASMGHLKREQFRILYLDKKNMLIADDLQEAGTVDQTPVYPREILRRALALEASAMILVHNHPSGNVEPSQADITITRDIIEAAKHLRVAVHDHVIVSATRYYSFKANGLM
jgi:DNA repair protein RadC